MFNGSFYSSQKPVCINLRPKIYTFSPFSNWIYIAGPFYTNIITSNPCFALGFNFKPGLFINKFSLYNPGAMFISVSSFAKLIAL